MRIVALAFSILVLSGCLKDGETKTTKCESNLQIKEMNTASTPTSFNFFDTIGVRINIFESIVVNKVMLKGTVPAGAAIHVDFYRNSYLDMPDAGVQVGSSEGTLTSTLSNGENWFVLWTHVQLQPTPDLMDGLAMVVHFGSGTFSLDTGDGSGSMLRSDFRTGSSGSWGNIDQTKMISVGFEGDVGCD